MQQKAPWKRLSSLFACSFFQSHTSVFFFGFLLAACLFFWSIPLSDRLACSTQRTKMASHLSYSTLFSSLFSPASHRILLRRQVGPTGQKNGGPARLEKKTFLSEEKRDGELGCQGCHTSNWKTCWKFYILHMRGIMLSCWQPWFDVYWQPFDAKKARKCFNRIPCRGICFDSK